MGTTDISEEKEDKSNGEIEGQQVKYPYPKSVFFIVSNEFCERFSYYGMRTILILYLTNILAFSDSDAKITYHTFTCFVYFFPLFGAILSDSYLGKFNTIFYVSIIYAAGSILLALASTGPINLPQMPFTLVGLFLIALGTGGIKPCVSAFGGDQFRVPEQELELVRFFSLFYFSINAGSFISTFLTPVLRQDVHCFGENSCYPLAFAVPGALMIVSIVIFGLGKPLYKIKKPQGNVVVQVFKCIGHALSQKRKSDKKLDHWLDYAEDKYGAKQVSDIKATLKVLLLYVPLPIFWALYDQQGSGWTFQAVRMNGDIGFYTILPDQMQVVNPILILAFIPLFTYGVYPLFERCHILRTPLQRMVCGGFLAAIAFAVTACVSLAIESTDPNLVGSGQVQLRFYNPSPTCSYKFSSNDLAFKDEIALKPLGMFEENDVKFSGTKKVTIKIEKTGGGAECLDTVSATFEMTEKTAYGIYRNGTEFVLFEDDVAKAEDGFPKVRTLSDNEDIIYYHSSSGNVELKVEAMNSTMKSISPGTYYFNRADAKNETNGITFELGGVYAVQKNADKFDKFTITEPNSIHILWLLPQYIILTAAEIMFSITGLEFSYSQAPVTMKSVLQAAFLLTTAIGNLIIVIVESSKIFEKASYDFFFYTALMVADMLLFAYLTTRYKYVERDENSDIAIEPHDKKQLENGIDNPTFKENNHVNDDA